MEDSADNIAIARTTAVRLFLLALLTALGLSHGAFRSPDSEVVYLTAESLAHRGTFALEHGCTLEGFGYGISKDGTKYAWFGPAQAVAWVPFVWLADAVGSFTDLAALGQHAPPSHHFANGFQQVWSEITKTEPAGEARRWIASALNALLHAATVSAFYLLILRLTRCSRAALLTAVLFGWCSLALPYSGDTFSETLATLFVVLSLYSLAASSGISAALGGLWLGLAITTHLTAILAVPFFAVLTQTQRRSLRPLINFGLGLAVPLLLLAWHNTARFGVPWETGRGIAAKIFQAQQTTVSPWIGLHGLLFSVGRGLIFYSPVIILGILGWRAWKRSASIWAWTLLAAFAIRLVFIATRREWHGGLALGPRYLLMMLPILLIPAAYWLRAALRDGHRARVLAIGACAALACAEQLYFCTGEYAAYYHNVKDSLSRHGINAFHNDLIYLEPGLSPLAGLHKGFRGPWILRDVPLTNLQLWFCLTLLAAPLIYLVFRRAASELPETGNDRAEKFQ